MKLIYGTKPFEIDINSQTLQEKSKDPNFVGELKYNGWRLMIVSDSNGNCQGFNSSGKKMSYLDLSDFKIIPNSELDCEWVDRRTTDVKDTIVVFDILKYKGQICQEIYKYRRMLIETLFPEEKEYGKFNVFASQMFENNFYEVFHQFKDDKMIEGLVLKKVDNPLEYSFKKLFPSPYTIKVKK